MRASLATTLVLLGCSSGTSSVPETQALPSFEVAVVVDPNEPPLAKADIERVVERASGMLKRLAHVGLHITEIRGGFPRAPAEDALVLARAYLDTRPSAPPDVVLVFSNDELAHTHGGWSWHLKPPYAFANRFPSPRPELGSDQAYVVIVEWEHVFARCGYDDAGRHVSDVSIGGECRNQPGTPCIEHGAGRWVCNTPDVLSSVNIDQDAFIASSIVHEIGHSFGVEKDGANDHWGTPQCVARTGMSADEVADDRAAEEFCQMCPDVYTHIPTTPTR